MNNTKKITKGKKSERKTPKSKISEPNRLKGFAQDQASMQRFDGQVVRNAQSATLPLMRQASSRERGPNTREKKGKRKLNKRLDSYLAMLSRPFDSAPVKGPVNYNPVPSFMTSTATTTYTATLPVAVSSCVQLCLSAHGRHSENDAMDGVSYHGVLQFVNGVDYTIGPVATTGPKTPIAGFFVSGLSLGSAASVSSGATASPIFWDTALPYSGVLDDAEHTRWKLLSMGVRLQNVTNVEQRSGDVTSVQPSNSAVLASQAAWAKYPTFDVSQRANTGTLELSWIPRAQDMAFWHSVASATDSSTSGAYGAIMIWLNNSSSVATQVYRVELVFHWELAGDNLVSIATPSILQPNDKSVIEPTLEVLKFTSGTAAKAQDIGLAVAGGSGSFLDEVGSLAATAVKKLGPSIIGAAASLF